MAIGGERRTQEEFSLNVGLFEGTPVAINPDVEKLSSMGINLKEDSKMTQYLGEKDGNTTLRLSVWVQEEKTEKLFNVSFYLENKEVTSKTGEKFQYVNSKGQSTWSDSAENLPEWFAGTEDHPISYHKAKVGEVDVMEFLNSWLRIDRSKPFTLEVDWSKLMRGNVRELTDLMTTDLPQSIICLAGVRVVEPEGEGDVKEYQSVYNRRFLPGFQMKNFRAANYYRGGKLDELRRKYERDKKGFKPTERFAVEVTDREYGYKDFFGELGELRKYNKEENVAASDKVISSEDNSY